MKRHGIRYRARLKLLALSHYSGGSPKCACCGDTNSDFLTIDHMKNDGKAHRKQIDNNGSGGGWRIYLWLRKHNYPEGFQILCLNCNFARGHFGLCPHKRGFNLTDQRAKIYYINSRRNPIPHVAK